MKRNRGVFGGGTLILSAFLLPQVCLAQTPWEKRDPVRVLMFHDMSARRVGDLLTIVIRENTDVDNKDERKMEKESGARGTFDFQSSGAANGNSASATANLDISGRQQQDFDGSTEYTVERGFTDRITVSVIDVLPNGNLVVGGKRQRLVSGEKRTLVVSGIVRPIDIRPDNSVDSPYIGDFQVNYQGGGQESRYTNHFWIHKTLRRIWSR